MEKKKKFNLTKLVDDTRKLFNKSDEGLGSIGVGDDLKALKDEDFLILPSWWEKATNSKGIPYGGYVMIAGDSDSGKTSMAITTMKAAQDQGIAILYVETENKTTTKDLQDWGVDPEQVMLVKAAVAEEAFTKMFALWDSFVKAYPDDRLLVVFDSIGNTVSRHDMQLDMMTENSKPGGKGKTNRSGVNAMVARMARGKVAGLIINYTYDNMGSPGKTNAGGKSLNFFSSATYQTSRKGWLERTVKGEKIRYGAKVQWRQFKNHINKTNPGPKVIELDITKDGMTLAGAADE